MSRHLGRVSVRGVWEPLRGRAPEEVRRPSAPAVRVFLIGVFLLQAVLNLGAGAGGREHVLGLAQLAVAVVWTWETADERGRYGLVVALVPGPGTLVMDEPGARRLAVALALRRHLGLGWWTAWALSGRRTVPLVVDVEPGAVSAAAWALNRAGARISLYGAPWGAWASVQPRSAG